MAFPNPPIPSNQMYRYLGDLSKQGTRLVPGGSDTIAATTTHNGTIFEIKEHALAPKNIVTGFEEYQESGSYSINALVYVTTGKTYTDASGNSYYSVPGTYICLSPVPPKVDTSTFDNQYLIGYYNNVTQQPGIVYAPVFVENDTRLPAYQTTDGNGKYWYLIAPATMIARSCQDNQEIVTYAAQQVSGSA